MSFFDFSIPDFSFAKSEFSAVETGPQWDIPLVANTPWFAPQTLKPGGGIDLANRSNETFWGFDQSKITSGLSNVLGSILEAGAKTGVQLASNAINAQANKKPGIVQSLANNFRSTSTGTQVNASAQAFSFMNILANPLVWFAMVAGVILIFVLRK